ncbi:MAG: glutamate--tRNA ligase, partial [Calditrichia bacterium]
IICSLSQLFGFLKYEGVLLMNQPVRTRFAPSPTGYLHVGGLRTALYNYLFARHHQGEFILRIEDTDQTRFVEGAAENLIQTLQYMGLDYDEGPEKSGPHEPYYQKQRRDIYKRFAAELVENGFAYPCFCTPEDLDAMRRKQEAQNLQPKYDRTCRNLTSKEIDEKKAQNTPFVIRLKMAQEGETRFHDLVRGEISVQNEQVDDQILVKSDGFPTYHLANVIDDHLMKISHVIRGEEWLLSVPKHLQLYRAFGWEPPQMAHLPLLLNPDRSKLSKRQGDVAVEDFLAKGYLPQAILNYVALLGWNSGTDREFFDLVALIDQFSLERVNKSGAVFDIQKLNWMNSHYIREMEPESRFNFLAPYLQKAGVNISDRSITRKIVEAVHKNLVKGEDIVSHTRIFYEDELQVNETAAQEILRQNESREVLQAFLTEARNSSTMDVAAFQQIMKKVQTETGYKKQQLWMPVRVALTGVTHGPDLPVVIEVLGKEKIIHFVEQALQFNGESAGTGPDGGARA